jgi:hypothetical protein
MFFLMFLECLLSFAIVTPKVASSFLVAPMARHSPPKDICQEILISFGKKMRL